MLRTILVGLDGSAYSHSAVELSLRWARRARALVVGLGIVDEPTILEAEVTPLGASYYKEKTDRERVAAARRVVDALLEEFAARCRVEELACKVVEDVGLPYEQILREAQGYDLIVLGQQTYFHFATQRHPCETLEKVLRGSPRPVVTVPEKLAGGGPVVVAYDSSLQAARALQAFVALELGGGDPVHVVSVAKNEAEAQAAARPAMEMLGHHELSPTLHALAGGDPATAILHKAQELDASLVVLGAYGQATLREFFLGSVTRTILRDARMPLFLYH